MKKRKPPEPIQHIADASDLRKWRTELPNLYDDADLTPYEFRLLSHYKRVGTCWEGTRATSRICQMSMGQVVAARRSLAQSGWIRLGVKSKHGTITITVVDVWAKNFKHYASAKRSGGEQRVHGVNTRSGSERGVHVVNERSNPLRNNTRKNKPNEEHHHQRQRKSDDDGSAKPNGLVAHLAQTMASEFGIDTTAAEDLARLKHVTSNYIQQWVDFSKRDIETKLAAHRDESVLGAGFYYSRIKDGRMPAVFGSIKDNDG